MKMLRLVSSLHPQIPSTSPKLSFTYKDASLFPKPQVQVPKYPSRFALFAQNGNKDDLTKEPNKKQEGEENPKGQPNGSINGGNSRNERRSMFNFRLGDLLDPDPDNIVALGLTGLLTWASVQVLWQLFLISVAILLAALKNHLLYSATDPRAELDCHAWRHQNWDKKGVMKWLHAACCMFRT